MGRDIAAGIGDRGHVALQQHDEVARSLAIEACPSLVDQGPLVGRRSRRRRGCQLFLGEHRFDLRMCAEGGDGGCLGAPLIGRRESSVDIHVPEAALPIKYWTFEAQSGADHGANILGVQLGIDAGGAGHALQAPTFRILKLFGV